METYKVYVFRHGQTYFNRDKRFTGFLESKLTPLGIKQARIVAKQLKDKKFEVAFQSHQSRAKDTLKEVLKFHPECRKIITDDRIIERGYGKLQGLYHDEIIKKYGQRQFDIWHRSFNIAPPGGESFAMVEKRVKSFTKFLIKFIKKNKVNVAISAHGNSIRLFRKIMEKRKKSEVVKWKIPYDKYFEYTITC